MPRFRRLIRPGDLVHLISRFVDGRPRLSCHTERDEYLRRLGAHLERSDWKLLSYALMSTHVHHALVAGLEPFELLIKSVHAPFAGWLNRRQGCLGPVFADRPKTLVVDPLWAARLIAYHHNNPARAGVVRDATASSWTSHRAYLGEVAAPDFLSVELGLELTGFGVSRAGRQDFAAYVASRQAEPRDPMLSGDLRRASRELRRALGAAVAIQHPGTGPDGLDYAPAAPAARWEGSLEPVISLVAFHRGLTPLEISGPCRRCDVTSARRLVAVIAGQLGRSNRETGLLLGVSEAAVRKLRRTATAHDRLEAERLGQLLRVGNGNHKRVRWVRTAPSRPR